MQLGIRLHDVKELPLAERLEEAKKQGFTCAHVALSKVTPYDQLCWSPPLMKAAGPNGHQYDILKENPVDSGALTPGYAMHLKRLFAEKGIDFAVLGCYLNLAHPQQEALAAIQETYLAHIRFAAILGCGVVGTETGAPNADYRYEPACRSREALEQLIAGLRPVVHYAEQMGVIVAIEPVAKHIVYNGARARELLTAIHSPNLQIILDPVNLLDENNYQNQEAVLEEAIGMLDRDIAVIHIKDFQVADGVLKSVAAGLGEMNYAPLISYLKKRKPYIHATLEDTQPENAAAARQHIRQLWERA